MGQQCATDYGTRSATVQLPQRRKRGKNPLGAIAKSRAAKLPLFPHGSATSAPHPPYVLAELDVRGDGHPLQLGAPRLSSFDE